MQLTVYAHPFDLEALPAHGGLRRLRDLGITEVALAVSYHDGRWLCPWQDRGRVRWLEDGTVHFRPRGDYGLLQPLASSAVPSTGPSPLERLCAEAPAAGLSVRAWTVLGHNSRLGGLHPQVCVQNAFGDPYYYALCPAQPAVQRYMQAMLLDLAAHAGLASIECEALGQMGHKHSSHHDKASFTPVGLLDAALSACFCSACQLRISQAGGDVAALRAATCAFLDAQIGAADAMAPAKVALGPSELVGEGVAWLDAVLAARASTAQQLASLVAAIPGPARAIQVHPNPWFTGSQLSAPAAAMFPATYERVLTCYGEGPEAIAKLLASDGAASLRPCPRRLCIWPKAPQFTRDEDLAKVRDLCREHGIAALSIYHLGLLPWRTLERVAKMFAA